MPADPVFLPLFQKLVPTLLESDWAPEDGLEPGELDALVAASPAAGTDLPLALREFHLALGNCSDLLETDHFFFDADELEVRDGYLMFLEDAEESTVWGLAVADAGLPDPLVWRRSTGADEPAGEWTCEGGTFSEFAVDLLEWSFDDSEDS